MILKFKVMDGTEISAEVSKDDYDFVQRISNNQFFKILGDEVSYWRWNNLSRIFNKVKRKSEKYGYKVKNVSPKFLSQFLDGASNEDNENIQEMWANIFLKESENENTYSLRTLNTLKMMSSVEAKLFFKVCPLFTQINGDMFLLEFSDLFEQYNLTYEKRLILQDVGVLGEQPMLPTRFIFNADYQLSIKIGDQVIILEDKSKTKKFVDLRVYNLTKSGNELYHVVNSPTNYDYNLSLLQEIKKTNKNLSVTLSTL